MELYYRESLNSVDKMIYDQIVEGFKNHSSRINTKRGSSDLKDILTKIKIDHPEFIHVDYKVNIGQTLLWSVIVPTYIMNKSEAESNLNRINVIAKRVKKETNGMSEYDKELYIHDYVTNLVTYNDSLGPLSHNMVGPLLYGKGVCDGYSAAIKYLLNYCGVYCLICVGKGINEKGAMPHAWNIVRINGLYYHLDATFNDSSGDNQTEKYDYFNLSEKEILCNHIIQYTYNFKCYSTKDNYFNRNGNVFDSEEAIKNYIYNTVKNNAHSINCGNKFVVSFKVIGSGDDVCDIVKNIAMRSIGECRLKNNLFGFTFNSQLFIARILFNY